MPIRKPQRETTIVGSILDYIKTRPDVFAYRNNTGAYRTESGGFLRYGYPGSADIIGVWNGKFLAIECKTARGKQDIDQVRFQRDIEKCGGLYLLARSWQEVREYLTTGYLTKAP